MQKEKYQEVGALPTQIAPPLVANPASDADASACSPLPQEKEAGTRVRAWEEFLL